MTESTSQQGPEPSQRSGRRSVQWWAALATVLAGVSSLASIPALVISVKAFNLSEQQRVDAQKLSAKQKTEAEQLRAETDLANQRGFIQRVLPYFDGAEITISNSNTITTYVDLRLDFDFTLKGHGDTDTLSFQAPACSQVIYRIDDPRLRISHEDTRKGYAYHYGVFSPADQQWWRLSWDPLYPPVKGGYHPEGTRSFSKPAESRELSGCA